jgi:colanic acid biosynthesis glycosyl transferase WcaI
VSNALKIQLWSHSFAPEPTGIGPVNTVLAQGLHDRGHQVKVVAAHPHYPEPLWGTRVRPYREIRDGISVVRLPMWVGRASTFQRYRQELTFATALTTAAPFLGHPDVIVSTSPMFAALLPAIATVRARRLPWILWLHDLLPDGAAVTGLVDNDGVVVKVARRVERAAYRTADRIVVLSHSFTENLVSKGEEEEKIELIYDPATRLPTGVSERRPDRPEALRILSMGNIGHSQGLAAVIQRFEAHPELAPEATLVVAGTGVAVEEAREEIRSERVQMVGLLDDASLERELAEADVGLVTQRYEGPEFNIPSKLMNFMAYGLPVLAAVDSEGEVARIIGEANAGWVVDSRDLDALPHEIARIQCNRGELRERALNARRYAAQHFSADRFVSRFEKVLLAVARHR